MSPLAAKRNFVATSDRPTPIDQAQRYRPHWRPPLGGLEGGTDAYYLQGQGGIPTVPAFGPGLLPLAHAPNEYVEIESVVQASKIYALAAVDYLG